MKNIIDILIKGMFIGIANIIPGISGGTMAFILGIYSKLTEAIGYFFIKPEKRKEYFLFLLNLGCGMVLGFLLFAKIISFLLGINQPANTDMPFSYVPTFGFFLGLIIGSIPVILKLQKDTKFTIPRLFICISGLIFLFVIASLREPTSDISYNYQLIKDFKVAKIIAMPPQRIFWLFIVGILASFTMVIPGISGSALLVSLGEYGPILNYISERSLIPIIVIGAGFAIGILLATMTMSKLLEHKAGATFYFILGLILASCIQILIQMYNAHADLNAWLLSIITTIIGIYLALKSSELQPKEKINLT